MYMYVQVLHKYEYSICKYISTYVLYSVLSHSRGWIASRKKDFNDCVTRAAVIRIGER